MTVFGHEANARRSLDYSPVRLETSGECSEQLVLPGTIYTGDAEDLSLAHGE